MLYWLYLMAAIVLEVVGTASIKLSSGFTKLIPSLTVIITYCLSTYLLSLSVKKIEISIAYAIWAGLGIALTTCIGVYFFKDTLTLIKIVCIALIIAGIIGLNLVEKWQ